MVREYKVITLCGSTRFKDAFLEAQKRLTLEENIVISVGLFGHSGDEEVWEEMDEGTLTRTKEMLDDMHKAKIDLADEIFVINVGGYIGDSTRSEIAYAKKTGKVVRYLETPAEANAQTGEGWKGTGKTGKNTDTMKEKRIVAVAEDYVRKLFAGDSSGHDAEHTFRVYQNAVRIANQEPGCDLFVVALAALLHDADDYKLFQTENDANARRFMAEQKVPDELADRICEVINSVSFSKNKGKHPSTLEGCIVQDADRLDAIGAIGVARTFAFGGEKGRSLDDTIQHFYDKLLLLYDQINTETTREEAAKRHSFLRLYLAELDREREWAWGTDVVFEYEAETAEENTDL